MGRARRSALTTRLAKAPCCLFHEKVEEMYRKTADKGMEEWKKEGGKSRFKSVGSVDNAVANERTATVVEDLGRALQVDGVKSEAAQAAQGAPPPYTA
jgi:hypothetical protein